MPNGYGESFKQDWEAELTSLEDQLKKQQVLAASIEKQRKQAEEAVTQYWKGPSGLKTAAGEASSFITALAGIGATLAFPQYLVSMYPENVAKRKAESAQWNEYAAQQALSAGSILRKAYALSMIGRSEATTFNEFVTSVNQLKAISLDESETAYLKDWWNRLRGAPSPAALPTTTAVSTKEGVVSQLIKPPTPKPVGLDLMTTDEIVKALQLPAMPMVPAMSQEDIKDIFGYDNLDQFLEDNDKELIKQWEDLDATMAAIKAGTQEPDIPPLTFWETVREIIVQPGLAALDLARAFSDYLSRPWSGMIMTNVMGGFQKEETSFEKTVNQARAEGKNWFMSYGAVHEDESNNWGLMLAAEILLDPTTYLGFGFVSKVVKPIPVVGRFLAAGNDAYIRMWDKAFISAIGKVRGIFPKLPSQKAAVAANAAKQTLRAAVVHATGVRDFTKITAEQLSKVAKDARDFVIKHPDFELTSEMSKFGSWQLKAKYIEADDVADLLKKVGAESPTTQNIVDINYVYNRTKFPDGKGLYTSTETASEIARILGVQNTTENLAVIKKFVDDRLSTEIATVEKIFSGNNPTKMVKEFAVHVDDVFLSSLNSKVYQHMFKQGLAASFAGKVEGFLKWGPVAALHEQFTVPMARQYLLFGSLGPLNAVESVFKGAFRGHNLAKPLLKSTNPTKLAQWVFADLPNAPVDIMDAIVRSEMWMMTEAGESALRADKSGMTRILDHIPGVGKPIQKIKPAAFRSITDWHEYWGEVGLRARSWYMVKQYMVELDNLAPEAMAAIKKRLPDIHSLGIKGLSKAELDDIAEYLPYAMISGRDAIKALKMSPSELFSSKVARAVDEELAQLGNMDDAFKEAIKHGMVEENAVQSAEKVNELMDKTIAGFKDSEIFKTMWAAELYDNLAKDFAKFVPANEGELAGMMRAVDEAVLGNVENLHYSRKLTTRRARELGIDAKEAYHDANWTRLQKYMDSTENSITEMTGHLRKQVDALENVSSWKWTQEWQEAQVLRTVDNWVARNPDKKWWFHGGPSFEEGKTIGSGYLTSNIEEAMEYAVDWAKTGEKGEAYIYAVDIGKAKVSRSHIPGLPENVQLDEPVLYSKRFDVSKHYAEPKQVAISADKATEIRAALDVWEAQTKSIHAAREITRDLYKKHLTGVRGANRTAGWNKYYKEADAIWDSVDDIHATLLKNRYKVSPGTIPPPQKIPGELTPAHIAYILGGTDDGLVASLMRGESHTLKSKVDFTAHVRAQAELVAAKVGKSADNIGFTKEAVDNCYDRLLRSMGIDPLSPVPELTPKLLEYENARIAMHKIRQTSGLDPDDTNKLNRFFDELAEDATKLPGTLPVTVSAVSGVKAPALFSIAGSKRELAPQILPYFGAVSGDIIDPFFGSGAIPLGLKKSGNLGGKIVAQEANEHIVELWSVARRRGQELFAKIRSIYSENGDVISKEAATNLRGKFNAGISDEVERNAVYMILARHAERKRIKYDSSGKITSSMAVATGGTPPFTGKWTTQYAEQIGEGIEAAKGVIVNKASKDSYIDAIRNAKSGDAIYLDPPYTGRTFHYPGERSVGVWSVEDTDLMLKEASAASKRGVRVVLSESLEGAARSEKYGFVSETIKHPRGRKLLTADPEYETVAALGPKVEAGAKAAPEAAKPVLRRFKFEVDASAHPVSPQLGADISKTFNEVMDMFPSSHKIEISKVVIDSKLSDEAFYHTATKEMHIPAQKVNITYTNVLAHEIAHASIESVVSSGNLRIYDEFAAALSDESLKAILHVERAQLKPITKATTSFERLNEELTDALAEYVLGEKAVLKQMTSKEASFLQKWFPKEAAPEVAKGVPAAGGIPLDIRTKAMENARMKYEIDFADYTNSNMADAVMRHIFPFWTYEAHRPWWIARNFLQKPGVGLGVGRYMEYTDDGYIPIPGSDIQINILRGSIFMGGFRRMTMKDFPEYYDRFPAFSQFWDALTRRGFYPGPLITVPMMLFGAANNKRQDWGEVLPAWIKTPLDAYMAAFPESKSAKDLSNTLMSDRFRDYYISLILNKKGFKGDVILAKRQSDTALEPDEEKAWAEALRTVSWFNGLNEQFGLFRLRPREMKAAYEAAAQLTFEMTGIPVETQDWVRKHSAITGKNMANYYPLDDIQLDMIYELSGIDKWSNMAYPLLPSLQQAGMTKTILFWEQVESKRDEAAATGLGGLPSFSELDASLLSYWANKTGGISPRDWKSTTGKLQGQLAAIIPTLKGNQYYKDVPVTLEERLEYYKKWRTSELVFHPSKELRWSYYELEPEYIDAANPKYDPDLGEGYDFDTYFAKTQAIIGALEPEQQAKFIQMLQKNWSPLYKLYWNTNRDYLRPYAMVRQAVLETQYSPEEQSIINQAMSAPPEQREKLRAIQKGGRSLVAGFEEDVRTARKNLRLINPQLDAWLSVWGVTKTLLTPQAQQAYDYTINQILSGSGE